MDLSDTDLYGVGIYKGGLISGVGFYFFVRTGVTVVVILIRYCQGWNFIGLYQIAGDV